MAKTKRTLTKLSLADRLWEQRWNGGVFLAGCLFTSFGWDPFATLVKDWFTAKPRIVVHSTEIRPLLAGSQFSNLVNLNLLFGTGRCTGTLIVGELGPLNRRMGRSWVPTILCRDCVEYSVDVANDGTATAAEARVTFSSKEPLQIRESDPEITQVSCGGMGSSKGCFVRIENATPGQVRSMTLVADGLEGISNTSCALTGEGTCEINKRRFWVKHIGASDKLEGVDMDVELDDGRTERISITKLPELSCADTMAQYYWDKKDSRWVSFGQKADIGIREMRCRDTPGGPQCVF